MHSILNIVNTLHVKILKMLTIKQTVTKNEIKNFIYKL